MHKHPCTVTSTETKFLMSKIYKWNWTVPYKRGSTQMLLCLFPGVLRLWHSLYSVGPHQMSSLHIYTFVVSRAFMAGASSQAGDADSSRAPGLTSGLQGTLNVHRGALLFVPHAVTVHQFFCILLHYPYGETWYSHALMVQLQKYSNSFLLSFFVSPQILRNVVALTHVFQGVPHIENDVKIHKWLWMSSVGRYKGSRDSWSCCS